MTTLEALKEIDYKNSTPDDVRSILADLTILCVPFYIRKGIYILRGRRGSGYTKRSQMTYCPAEKCISMQRATLKGQTSKRCFMELFQMTNHIRKMHVL